MNRINPTDNPLVASIKKFADLRKANRSPGKSFAEFGGYTGAALNETEKKLLQDYIKKNGPIGDHPAPGSIIDPEGEGRNFNYESIQKEEDKLIEQEENDAGYNYKDGGTVNPDYMSMEEYASKMKQKQAMEQAVDPNKNDIVNRGRKSNVQYMKFLLESGKKRKFAQGGVIKAADGYSGYSPEIQAKLDELKQRNASARGSPQDVNEQQSLESEADLQNQLNPGMAEAQRQMNVAAEQEANQADFETNYQPLFDREIQSQTGEIKNSVAGRTQAHAPGMSTEEAPMPTGIRAPAQVAVPEVENKVDIEQAVPEAPGSGKPLPERNKSYDISHLDSKLITEVEGGQKLDGYYPGGSSGVTIASGFDLGQMDLDELNRLPFPKDLKEKLAPYVGTDKQGAVAQELLKTKPLKITDKEAKVIDPIVINRSYSRSVSGLAEQGIAAADLDPKIQTIVTSLSHHHGGGWTTDPKASNLVDAIRSNDKTAVANELKEYKKIKGYPSRGEVEANYLLASEAGGGQPSMALGQSAEGDQSKPEDPMTTMLKQYMAQRQGYKADVADARRRQGLIAALNAIGDASRGVASGSVQAKGGLPMTQPKWDSKVPSLADMGVVKPETADLKMMQAFMPKTITPYQQAMLKQGETRQENLEKFRDKTLKSKEAGQDIGKKKHEEDVANRAALSEKQSKEYGNWLKTNNTLAKLDDLLKEAEKVKQKPGYAQYFKTKAKAYFPGSKADIDFIKLRSLSDAALFEYVKQISGAQFSAQEFERYSDIMPNSKDNPDIFRGKMASWRGKLENDRNGLMSEWRSNKRNTDLLDWKLGGDTSQLKMIDYEGKKYWMDANGDLTEIK